MVVEDRRTFGRYRVTGTLGVGGMGEVFAAVDDVLGREVAVKTLRGKHAGLAARLLDDRFRQEARAIASLSHPGVVQVFDIDLAAEPPYIVMERVVGPSLKERIANGPLATDELRALGIQVARALAAAHAGGILHRDVKPANILAAAGGTWKLADFGVAHVPDSEITMTGQFVGSPAYAPPEALVRGESTAAGDLYGLGASLYQAAVGRWPRAESTTGALLAPVPPLATLAPHLPADLAAAIDRAVAVEPGDRPTASELAEALAGSGTTVPVAAPLATPVPGTMVGVPVASPVTPRRATTPLPIPPLRWKSWAIAIGLVLLIGTVAALSSRSRSSTTATAPAEQPAPEPRDPERPPPDPSDGITVTTPEAARSDRRAEKEWRRVVDKLYKGDLHEAIKKLGEFEHKWGESDETRQLRDQLAAFPTDREDD